MPPFRVVVAGLIHDHAWSMLPQFAKLPSVELVGGADPNKPLRDRLKGGKKSECKHLEAP